VHWTSRLILPALHRRGILLCALPTHLDKFVIAAIHEADTLNDCSVVECPGTDDWFSWPADKDAVSGTINADHGYIVKDTAVMPAGAYLRVRAKSVTPSAATLTHAEASTVHTIFTCGLHVHCGQSLTLFPHFSSLRRLPRVTTDHMFADC